MVAACSTKCCLNCSTASGAADELPTLHAVRKFNNNLSSSAMRFVRASVSIVSVNAVESQVSAMRS